MRRKTPHRQRPPAGSAGFSVLETLVVVLVLGIALAVGVPSLLGQLGKLRLESSASDIANLMSQTRLRAIRDNASYTVGVVSGKVVGMGAFGADQLDLELEDPVSIYNAGDGAAVCLSKYDGSGDTYGANNLTFQGTGVATDTGAVCIHDGKGNILQVVLEYTTAQPKIRKYLPAAAAPAGEGFYEKTGFNVAAGTGNVWVWY